MIVDAVSSWGGMPAGSGEFGRPAFSSPATTSASAAPPGLSLVAVSEAAWAKIDANPDAPFASILSLGDWKNAWKKTEKFPFTPSVAEINGLDAALDRYLGGRSGSGVGAPLR